MQPHAGCSVAHAYLREVNTTAHWRHMPAAGALIIINLIICRIIP